MTCREVRALADEVAAGKAEPELEARARAHAVDCDACAVVMERAVAFRLLLDTAKGDLSPSPDFVTMVRERILAERIRPRLADALAALAVPRSYLLRGAALVGVAALLVFVILQASTPIPNHGAGQGLDGASRQTVTQAGLAPEVEDALENAAASNEADDLLFADTGVVEIARAQASNVATSCLDM